MSNVEECPSQPFVRRRLSCSSIPASPSSSSYKMSVDLDDARSISSITTASGNNNNNNNNNRYRHCILRHWQNETTDILPPSITIGSPFNNNNSNSSNMNNNNNNNPNNNSNNPQQSILWQTNTSLSSLRQNNDMKITNNRSNNCDSMLDNTSSPNTPLTKSSSLSLNQQQQQITKPMEFDNIKPSTSTSSSSLRTSRSTSSISINHSKDPERRTVRRSSLLPKSKALSRVIHQTEEEIHLSELEMRREQCTTQQLKENNGQDLNSIRPPPANWIHLSASAMSPIVPHTSLSTSSIPSSTSSSPSMIPYQSSKLNPELEMTNFQFDNLPSPIQSISSSFRSVKRKASEDRLDSFFTATSSSASLKRRAVSPSISLTGSPVLTAMASPPTSNAAARAQQKPNQNSGFNLYEASGGLSRMSLSE
ncbi:unnamed protein product [Cunninghamella echinulata]